MKKIVNLLTIAVVTILVAVACSKDQKVVNQLEGTWKVTAMKENGIAAPSTSYANTSYTFEKCKVKKEACPGTLSSVDPTKGSVSYPFTYTISDKGETFTQTISILGFTTTTTSTIKEHSKTTFVFEYTDGADKIETTLTKQ